MKTKIDFDEETVSKLKLLLEDLKTDRGDPLEELALVMHRAGISWDKAIAAHEKREPEDFFNNFDDYYKKNNVVWKIVCGKLDIELLASLLAHEARGLTHWDGYYNSSYYPFFIAGLERLLSDE